MKLIFTRYDNVNSEECVSAQLHDGSTLIIESIKYNTAPADKRDNSMYWLEIADREGLGYDSGMYMLHGPKN